jgi:RNA 2',3'-cyclic 3'-phosphodiesterase
MFQKQANDSFRAFFAIDLPKEAKQHIAKVISTLKKQKKYGFIKWTKTENLHITVRFLGNITPAQYQQIIENLKRDFTGLAPFKLSFSEIFMFPGPENPIVLALKPSPIIELVKINRTLENLLTGIDVKEEKRSFAPHLTLGKIEKHGYFSAPQLELPNLSCEIKDVTLFKSELAAEGSIYTPMVCCVL